MIKAFQIAIASIGMLGLVACTQGDMEEIGEDADNASERANTGKTDPGQGPMEEMGEQHDEVDK